VFHGVAWQSRRDGAEGDGEADFVLLHPRVGLLVLEVKGGSILVADGRWASRGADGVHRIRNPYEQATASQHALVRFLRTSDASLDYLPAGHAVVFPDVDATQHLGPAATPAITLSREDLSNLASAIQRVVDHWNLAARLDPPQVTSIVRLLAPTITVERLLRDEVAEANARLLTLTAEQMQVLDGLRRNRKVTVFGGAGTGKTVLAVDQARRLAAAGFSTLLTCYNRPLAEHLADVVAGEANIEVVGFHALCRRLMLRAGMTFPDDPVSDRWWDDQAPDALVKAASALGQTFDAIVIDEGQDFSAEMFLALEALLARPDSPRLVFADSHQAVYRDDWEPPLDGVSFDLTVNCRNTVPIAGLVARTIGDPPVSTGAAGPEPERVTIQSPEGIQDALGTRLRRLLEKEGMRPEQIAVVTQRRQTRDRLTGKSMGKGITLFKPADPMTQPLDLGLEYPDAAPAARRVAIDTIHRFKGLEADVVIVIFEQLDEPKDWTLAYIGTSRACAHLIVIAPPEVHKRLTSPPHAGDDIGLAL
jgi:hypothetical protein